MSIGESDAPGGWDRVSTFARKVHRKALTETLVRRARNRKYRRVWIDVGAHEGETTFPYAAQDPGLLVYAFEPDLRVASRVMGRLRNFVMLPFAIAERDGTAELQLNAYEQSSSLLPPDPIGVKSWITELHFEVIGAVNVPTMRLDTFLNAAGLKSIDFLKVDAQGLDLEVVRSAGDRLTDIAKVQLEATTAAYRQYEGAPDRFVIVDFMESKGFRLTQEDTQSHGQEANLTFVRA